MSPPGHLPALRIPIPDLCLVVLVGVAGSGKTTFAAAHFRPSEVLSSDACRVLVGGDVTAREVTAEAYEALRSAVRTRLAARRLTVVDATNLRSEVRRDLATLARRSGAAAVALVFDLPEALCRQRVAERPRRYRARTAMEHAMLHYLGPRRLRRQVRLLRGSRHRLPAEGFQAAYCFTTPEEVAAAHIERRRGVLAVDDGRAER